jgi:hypothetical protein
MQKDPNSAKIVVSLQEGQEALNIVRRAVGLGNHMSLTDSTIMGGRAEKVILNSDHPYLWNRYKRVINSDNE